MSEQKPVYKRRIFDPRSWSDFAVGHVAYALHRVTGWLLIGWVGLHLVWPLLAPGSSATVYIPGSDLVFIGLFAVLLFHGFNGIRLMIVELGGITPAGNRWAFWVSLVASVVLLIPLGVGL